ncbi:DUF1711-domain-containing protein [Viridothelium virens]|uniref:DUF1711-domain-containing protein n=1 Tax=Viridothelium virens TaxID=1048519 RepID=A0A6A6H840_VIRVR|nr:DUF1711-domain-containing protein [Viridothelium virens]
MATSTRVSSSPAVTKSSTKGSKKSKIVKLSLSSKLLAQFEPPPRSADSKPSRATSSTPSTAEAAPPAADPPTNEAVSESNATPGPTTSTPATDGNSLTVPSNGSKKKGIPGPKPGAKRGAGMMADGQPKPRGKPGPKKKPRLPDGTIDHGGATPNGGPFASVAPIAPHKLGPKANQGAINAQLRALDRSGKPCRKWERKPFQLKSFTGVLWNVGTWRAPQRVSALPSSESKSDSADSSEVKAKFESSAMASENGTTGLDAAPDGSHHLASSPIPMEVA